MEEAGNTGTHLQHRALFYRTADEYVAAVADFLLAGAAKAEPALVAVPGERHAELRRALEPRLVAPATSTAGLGGTTATMVTGGAAGAAAGMIFADMSELGRNPARIMPALQSFIDSTAGQRTRFVGEPIWPGRSVAEMREATRHEALINVAFSGTAMTTLCPYDVARLPEQVIADACRTHPLVATDGDADQSPMFAGAGSLPPDCDLPLSAVPAGALTVAYQQELREVRTLIARQAGLAGLAHPRVVDYVLAVSEVAANTLRHTNAGGSLSIWRTPQELTCQLHDTGHITDPLAGRRFPNHDHRGGQGLWLVNQVCDLVEVRTGSDGTVVRLHMTLKPTARQAPETAPAEPAE